MCGPSYWRCPHIRKGSRAMTPRAQLTFGTTFAVKVCESCIKTLKTGNIITITKAGQTRNIGLSVVRYFYHFDEKMRTQYDRVQYKTTAIVKRKVWGPDDYYHTIEVQVDDRPELGELKEGDIVKVIIEKT